MDCFPRVVDTFRLDAVATIAVAGIIVANRTIVALTATYLPWLSADCFAALLAGFAFYLWSKQTEKSAKVRATMKRGCLAISIILLAGIFYFGAFKATKAFFGPPGD